MSDLSEPRTVGEILDRMPRKGIVPFPATLPPGIYFGMDESQYHAIPALSSSGIRDMLISPLDYWTSSVFNPDRKEHETKAMADGTAFHRRLLEPERFAAFYAGKPSKEDYADAIDGGEALKAECERLGLKKSGRIMDLCERILDAEPAAELWPVIERELLAGLSGRTLLSRETMGDIERTARIVFAHQSAARALTGGMPEVTVLWIDEETGVPMKIRADYLKTKAIIDVKTFSNSLGKPIAKAIASAVTNNRYDVQAVVYDDGIAHAKAMLRKVKTACLNGPQPSDDWLVSFAACERHTFAFLFIEQGPVTNVRLREFRESEGREGSTANLMGTRRKRATAMPSLGTSSACRNSARTSRGSKMSRWCRSRTLNSLYGYSIDWRTDE